LGLANHRTPVTEEFQSADKRVTSVIRIAGQLLFKPEDCFFDQISQSLARLGRAAQTIGEQSALSVRQRRERDRKPYQASSFENPSGRSMTSIRMGRNVICRDRHPQQQIEGLDARLHPPIFSVSQSTISPPIA
jgi:hypothetical protein